ncbi:glycosyltransferase, partial [Lactobacillus paragasseri]
DGELKNDLKREVELLNLASNIKFLGIRQDVKNLMFMSDVLLFPSFYEGLPVVLVEAQATGLKAVISNTISKEIDITPNIERIDISKSPSQYAELALKKASEISISDRNKAYLKVREAGYDIANTVKMLEEIYSVEY